MKAADKKPHSTAAEGAASVVDKTGAPVVIKSKRRHLEGLGYYLVYVPALVVAVLTAPLFVAAIDELLYGED